MGLTDRRSVLCPSQLQGRSRKQGRDEQGKERAQARAQPGELGQRTTVYVRGKQAVAREQSPREYRGRFDEKSLKRARASEGVSKDDGTEAEARSWVERVPAAGALRRRQEQVWLLGRVRGRRHRSATQGVQTRTAEDLSPRGRDEQKGGRARTMVQPGERVQRTAACVRGGQTSTRGLSPRGKRGRLDKRRSWVRTREGGGGDVGIRDARWGLGEE